MNLEAGREGLGVAEVDYHSLLVREEARDGGYRENPLETGQQECSG